MTSKAKFGDTVTVHFTCKLDDGSVVDSSDGREPLTITIGKSGFMKSFERAFIGMEPGETKSLVIPADQAYGPYEEALRQMVSREQFPADLEPEVGMQIIIKADNNEQGEKVIRVVEVTDSGIVLDANPVLAGNDLFFDIKLVDITKRGPSAHAHYALGSMVHEEGYFEEAIEHYLQAVEIEPDFVDAHFKLGILYQLLGRSDEAITQYRKVLQLKGDHVEALINLGNVLRITGKIDEAVSYFHRALDIKPDHTSTFNNLGVAFRDKGDADAAILHYKKAIELDDAFAEAHNNLGMALQETARWDEAEDSFRKAIQSNSELAEAHFNLGSLLLLSGKFREGWEEYEWRLKLKQLTYDVPENLWDGSNISGKTILLKAEQGFGDTLQFIRYAPLVAEKGAIVLVSCQQELSSLLETVPGVQRVFAYGESVPPVDCESYLLSLPRIFGTTLDTVPADIPYIKVDSHRLEKWTEQWKDDQSTLKIGIAWSGDPAHKRDYVRSLRLRDFAPLLQMNEMSFFALQKDKFAAPELHTEKDLNIFDFTHLIEDFADTAALMTNLDLIITVDTAAAHLAGALGKPVWTLLPFSPDWRWMLEREDSPWYPTMRLFRQPTRGDWDSVIKRVVEELKKII